MDWVWWLVGGLFFAVFMFVVIYEDNDDYDDYDW